MMMNLLTGVALWMVAAVALGLLFGRAMHGYGVGTAARAGALGRGGGAVAVGRLTTIARRRQGPQTASA